MKQMNKKFIAILMVTLVSLTLYSYKSLNFSNPNIQGTWVSEDDANWRMVFDSTTCKWYYNNQLQDNYSYQISNSSPQCDKTVLVDSNTEYLSITNTSDNTDKICYEIYGLTDDTLTLRVIDRGGFLIFHK